MRSSDRKALVDLEIDRRCCTMLPSSTCGAGEEAAAPVEGWVWLMQPFCPTRRHPTLNYL